MIQCSNINFSYRKKTALDGCSFTIENGSICGLLGRNGAGKTTLLKVLSGLLLSRQGELNVNGFNPAQRQAHFYANLAYVPQELPVPNMKVQTYANICGGLYPNFSNDSLDTLFQRFHVDPNSDFGELSGGDLRKAWLCFAMACRTPLVFLDEPSQGLDIPAQETLRQVLAEEGSAERIILLSTHHVREIENLVDSLLVMNNKGSIICSGRTEDIFNEYRMVEVSNEDLLPARCLYKRRTAEGWKGICKENPTRSQTIPLELLFHALTGPTTAEETVNAE
ncbi:ATP-binding cassette domain-containing protein [Spirochaeta dissipatitropha]